MSDFRELVDLAAKRLGGMAVAANDEFFAPKENVLLPDPPVFDPHRYTDRGKEMDGWETRRRREPGHDWCVVRLGVPGIVRGVVVDTTHFRGNYPDRCSLDGADVEGADPTGPEVEWFELLPESKLEGDSVNEFAVDSPFRVTHVRLNIHPDGGVARLRVHGEPLPDLRRLVGRSGEADLAAVTNGGLVLEASDTFFASPHNLTAPGGGRDMSDGWETRRRRGPGHDWVVVRLAAEGELERVEVDTANFKGNYPDTCSLDVAGMGTGEWAEALPHTKLGPHARHVFRLESAPRATHVRLNIHPDGGIARLRVHGRVTDDGWRGSGVRWLNASTPARCEAELLRCCGSRAWARQVTAGRPFEDFRALTAAADEVWNALKPEDRREAFAAHPRIGERSASEWSSEEQSGVTDGATELAEANRAYEERFGHVFLINVTGKTAEQVLAALRERTGNASDVEFAVASEEQRQITRLRLEKLVRP